MKLSKKWGMALLSVSICLSMALPVFAGQWVFDGPKDWQWWYKEEDGTYPKSEWKEIDGEWYHFDKNGYLDVGGWLNSPLSVQRKVGEKVEDLELERWYFLERSGKMLKNQNYIGGYTDGDGLLHFDRLSKDGQSYERYHGQKAESIPKPIPENAEDNGQIQAYDDFGKVIVDFAQGGWKYPITDYKKEFFAEFTKHILQEEKEFTVPISKENYNKEYVLIQEGCRQVLANNNLGIGGMELVVDDQNVAHFSLKSYYHLSE